MKNRDRQRWLRKRIEYVRVHSNADGSFGIEARWRAPYAVLSDAAGLVRDMPPGLFTRMETAEKLERVLNEMFGHLNGERSDSAS